MAASFVEFVDTRSGAKLPTISHAFAAQYEYHPMPFYNDEKQHHSIQSEVNSSWPVSREVPHSYKGNLSGSVLHKSIIEGRILSTKGKQSSTGICIETGIGSNTRNCKAVGGLLNILCNNGTQWHSHESNCPRLTNEVCGHQVQGISTGSKCVSSSLDCIGGVKIDRCNTSHGWLFSPSTHFEELRRRIPLRDSSEQSPFKEFLQLNFSEALEQYKKAVGFGSCARNPAANFNLKPSLYTKTIFSWEEVEKILGQNVPEELDLTSLAELIDLGSLGVSSNNLENRPFLTRLGSSSLSWYKLAIRQQPAAPSAVYFGNEHERSFKMPSQKGALLTAVNRASTNCTDEKIRQTKSSWTDPTRFEETQDISRAQFCVDIKGEEGDFYMDHYPSLRGKSSLVTNCDDSLESDKPTALNDDEISAEMIIRPRSYPDRNYYEINASKSEFSYPPVDDVSGETFVNQILESPEIAACETGGFSGSSSNLSSSSEWVDVGNKFTGAPHQIASKCEESEIASTTGMANGRNSDF